MAGVKITQLDPTALPGRRYGSFGDKTVPPTHPVGEITRLWPYGGPGHIRGSFAGKAVAEAAAYILAGRRGRRR